MQTGIDLGLTCTSMVTIDDKLNVLATISFGSFKNGPQLHPIDRYQLYCDKMIDYFVANNITGSIIMEDPHARWQGAATKLLELKGVFLIVIGDYFESNKVFLPKATKIKKGFTTNGRASKEDMIEECKKHGFIPNNEHEADSFGMAYLSAKGLL